MVMETTWAPFSTASLVAATVSGVLPLKEQVITMEVLSTAAGVE